MSPSTTLLVTGVVGAGLVAGLFGGWAVSMVPGLRHVDDRTYVATMQAVNRSILNPLFLVPFTASGFALAAAAILAVRAGDLERARFLFAAAALYLVGVFGLTAGGNVPLNNRLDRFVAEDASPADVADARRSYEGPWNRLHSIRSVISVIAVVLGVLAALS